MPQKDKESGHALLVATLSQARKHRFSITPTEAERAAISRALEFNAIRKLRFDGEIRSAGKREWRLDATLGATVVQPCVQTLAPVVTRIDTAVTRVFVPDLEDGLDPGTETEMPEDDTMEPLGSHIDPWQVMIEALALDAPDYPRAADAPPMGAVAVTEPGKTPMRDEDTKPFAGLAGLRDSLRDTPDSE